VRERAQFDHSVNQFVTSTGVTLERKNECALKEQSLKHFILKFLRDRSAATSIEYALIAGGIFVVIVAAVNGLGTTLNTKYSSVSTALK